MTPPRSEIMQVANPHQCRLKRSISLSNLSSSSDYFTKKAKKINRTFLNVASILDEEEVTNRAVVQPPEGAKRACPLRMVDMSSWTQLGSGSYGIVYKASMKMNNDEVKEIAIKRVEIELAGLASLRNEIEIWKELIHPNIVQFIGVHRTKGHIQIGMEYGSGGDLYTYIEKNEGMGEEQAKDWFRQIASAISYMHDKNYAHRDIKPENVILFPRNVVKVTDFGFSEKYHDYQSGTICGSSAYTAPEMSIVGVPCNLLKTDVWSLGILLYAMLTGGFPFDDQTGEELMSSKQMIRESLKEVEGYYSKECADTLRSLLSFVPEARPYLSEILQNRWLAIN